MFSMSQTLPISRKCFLSMSLLAVAGLGFLYLILHNTNVSIVQTYRLQLSPKQGNHSNFFIPTVPKPTGPGTGDKAQDTGGAKGVPQGEKETPGRLKEAVHGQTKDASKAGTVSPDQAKNAGKGKSGPSVQWQTSGHWPVLSKDYFPGPIPPSPYHPNYTIHWDFNTSAFLQRPDVKGQPPKLITWMVKPRFIPHLPEPVRLRVCPEMPCRMTTNKTYQRQSAALLWNGQIMRDTQPVQRSFPDQVFVFHNNEPQLQSWIYQSSFRKPAWKSAFNWTMTYRSDSDIRDLYGYVVKRDKPLTKNYTAILARKKGLAVWLVSNRGSSGQRDKYVELLRRHMQVDTYGESFQKKCPRNQDDACYQMISRDYKFFLALESAFCQDYITEKFFRYLATDTVVVARGSNQYKNHAPPGTFINTADFNSTRELAGYLHYLDSHPEDYLQLLKTKDQFQVLYEDWPIRNDKGAVLFMHYHYQSVSYCEMCRRLWELDKYRKTIPDIVKWFDKLNCYQPHDLV